ncbi:hypothetical protein J4217_02450 [Candidatus Pacearchaeota archaeon]|nr:hypothetical protein [Candidatus Pacearchaeota archaeon]
MKLKYLNEEQVKKIEELVGEDSKFREELADSHKRQNFVHNLYEILDIPSIFEPQPNERYHFLLDNWARNPGESYVSAEGRIVEMIHLVRKKFSNHKEYAGAMHSVIGNIRAHIDYVKSLAVMKAGQYNKEERVATRYL